MKYQEIVVNNRELEDVAKYFPDFDIKDYEGKEFFAENLFVSFGEYGSEDTEVIIKGGKIIVKYSDEEALFNSKDSLLNFIYQMINGNRYWIFKILKVGNYDIGEVVYVPCKYGYYERKNNPFPALENDWFELVGEYTSKIERDEKINILNWGYRIDHKRIGKPMQRQWKNTVLLHDQEIFSGTFEECVSFIENETKNSQSNQHS